MLLHNQTQHITSQQESAHCKKPQGREVAISNHWGCHCIYQACCFILAPEPRQVWSTFCAVTIHYLKDSMPVLSSSVFNQQGLHYHQHCLLSQTLCTADLPNLVHFTCVIIIIYEYICVCVQLVHRRLTGLQQTSLAF